MEKTYTFRKFAYASALNNGAVSEDQIRDNLIETQLNNGYYPIDVKVEKLKDNSQQEYLVATAKTAYAGKRMARELWRKNPFLESPKMIILNMAQ